MDNTFDAPDPDAVSGTEFPIPPPPSIAEQASRTERFREMTEAAAESMDEVAVRTLDEKEARYLQQRLTAAQQFWVQVNQVRSLFTTDQALQDFVRKLELTRDKELDRTQYRDFVDLLGPRIQEAELRLGSQQDANFVLELVYDELTGISVLGPLWRKDDITEILVDSWDKVSIEQNGTLYKTPVRFMSPEHASATARILSQKVTDRPVSPSMPIITSDLPEARAMFVVHPVAKSGVVISLRKFRPLMGMDGLLALNSLTPEMAEFLNVCVRARANILVSGGTGTGKTTMINALSESIPNTERVITIEDSYELKLSNEFWVPLQTKEKVSLEDEVQVTLHDLLVATLRMRPDRIIVGEVREAKGATTMLNATNTGHDGSMTTIHATTPMRAVNFRLAGMVRTATSGMSTAVAVAEVASAINLVVHITRKKGLRFISEIAVVDVSQITGEVINPQPIFKGNLRMAGDSMTTEFKHVGLVGGDTELGMKLTDSGFESWVDDPQ